jgi:hypothetical protein
MAPLFCPYPNSISTCPSQRPACMTTLPNSVLVAVNVRLDPRPHVVLYRRLLREGLRPTSLRPFSLASPTSLFHDSQ